MEDALNRYGIKTLKKSGNSLYGPCPIHHGDNPTAFRVSLNKNLWHCFTHCGGGSVIDFIMQMEGLTKSEAAKRAEEWIGNGYDHNERKIIKEITKIDKNVQKNPPLEFRLTLDPTHNYLKERRISLKTAKYFDIGYCNSGLLKERIAIPIHDEEGQLVAYCGRAIDDKDKDKKPKYKFPEGFKKSLVVYNLHRVKENKEKEIALVEGYFDLFRLYQAGYEAVALMGSAISEAQEKQILALDKQIILLFDGDKAGKEATKKAIDVFKGKIPFKVKYLPQDIQPDDLKEQELKELLG